MRVSYLTINIKIIKFKRSNSKSMVLHLNNNNKKTILILLTQDIQLEKFVTAFFQKHGNSEIQKPTSDYVFRCRQSS